MDSKIKMVLAKKMSEALDLAITNRVAPPYKLEMSEDTAKALKAILDEYQILMRKRWAS